MAWPKTPDGEWYQFDGEILIPVNPAAGSAILYLRPTGGMGQGIPPVEKGDPGLPPTIDTAINMLGALASGGDRVSIDLTLKRGAILAGGFIPIGKIPPVR